MFEVGPAQVKTIYECPKCGNHLKSGHYSYNNSHKTVTRECSCGFKEVTHTLTQEAYKELKAGAKRRCECGSFKRATNRTQGPHYAWVFYQCKCGAKETLYELTEEVFKKLVSKAKLETKGTE